MKNTCAFVWVQVVRDYIYRTSTTIYVEKDSVDKYGYLYNEISQQDRNGNVY